MDKEEQRALKRKLHILELAKRTGNIAKTCWYFGIPRSLFYVWLSAYNQGGEQAFISHKPIPKPQPNKTPYEIVEKVLHLGKRYHLEPIRNMWYLQRYIEF